MKAETEDIDAINHGKWGVNSEMVLNMRIKLCVVVFMLENESKDLTKHLRF